MVGPRWSCWEVRNQSAQGSTNSPGEGGVQNKLTLWFLNVRFVNCTEYWKLCLLQIQDLGGQQIWRLVSSFCRPKPFPKCWGRSRFFCGLSTDMKTEPNQMACHFWGDEARAQKPSSLESWSSAAFGWLTQIPCLVAWQNRCPQRVLPSPAFGVSPNNPLAFPTMAEVSLCFP